MARLSYGSVTYNSFYAVIVELNTNSTYSEIYITCNGIRSPNLAPSRGSSTSSGYTFTGLAPNSTYIVSYTLLTTSGSTGSGDTTVTTGSAPSPPATPSWVSAYSSSNAGTIMYADWAAVSGATQYYVTLRLGSSPSGTQLDYKYVSGSSTTTFFTGLSEWTYYTITVSAINGNGTGGYNYDSERTIDSIAPVISSLSIDGAGRVQVAFSAYDAGSGLRGSNSSYYVEISNPNGTSYGNGLYQDATYRVFTEDAFGNEFIHDAFYTVRVTAIDKETNASATTIRVQFKRTRPVDWSWINAKTSGQTIYFPATEWTAFCNRVNAFRQFKNLGNYSFTTVYSGNPIYAWQINEAISAVNSMITNKISTQYSGANANADVLNSLTTRLNSIQ